MISLTITETHENSEKNEENRKILGYKINISPLFFVWFVYFVVKSWALLSR